MSDSLFSSFGAKSRKTFEKTDALVYQTKYIHKIAPKDSDRGPFIRLSSKQIASKTKLAAALRLGRVLDSGARIRSYRVELDGKIIVFLTLPGQSTYWHSVVLLPVRYRPRIIKRPV
jgi:hypothetical protein